MAITVSHQPDYAMLARAGYRVGAGEAMQHYQDQQHQAAMQERALQANSMNQQVAHLNSLQRMQYGAQLEGQARMEGYAQADQLNKQRIDAGNELRKMQLQSHQDELQTQFEQTRQQKILDASNQQERDINQFLLKQSGSHLTQVEKLLGEGMQFEDGGTKYAAVKAEMDRVWDEDTLTPTAKSQAIYELSQQIPVPTVRPQNSQERIDQDVIERVITMPDGTQVPTLWSVEPDGTIRMHDKIEPDTPKEPQPGKTGTITEQAMSDLGNYMKVRGQAIKELEARKYPDGENMGETIPYTEEQIKAKVEEILKSGSAADESGATPKPNGGKLRLRLEGGTWQQVS